MTFLTKRTKWKNKKNRISYNIKKKSKNPRLIVFRSNRNIFIQLLDDLNINYCTLDQLEKRKENKIERVVSFSTIDGADGLIF